jgi:TolA-binding protein
MRSVVLLCIFVVATLWAEPSVYSKSGSYVSATKIAKKNRNSIISLRQEVSDLKQEIEGLKSIVEGLSITLNEIKQKDNTRGSNDGQLDRKLIQDLGDMIDKIDKNYVSKADLKKALKSGKTPQTSKHVASKDKTEENIEKKPKKDSKLDKAESSALYSRGVRLVKKKKYTMAKLRFDILKSRGYKKASTNFYLGEIAYRTKSYSDAIEYYKISAGANESANYMDTLLLHTGLSLVKQGDKSQAKRFFQAIVDGYPDTGSAKVAKKYL